MPTTDLLGLWPDLVDSQTGIVREVVELHVDDDAPGFVHYLSRAADTAAFGLLPNFGNNGGAGATARTALAKALGEAVERYCSAVFDYDDLRFCSYRELGARATDPAEYALYSERQYAAPGFPWTPFERDTVTGWVPGLSLVTGDTTWVPAAFVYVPYHFRRELGDHPITQPISTGLACGSSLEDARRSALCEVIERDAFTLTWQGRLARPRIAPTGLPLPVADLLRRFTRVGVAVHLVDISVDVPCPVVLSVAQGLTRTSPAIAVAAAAHPDPTTAACKSLEELAHTRRFSQQVMDHLPPVVLNEPAEHPQVDGQRAHLRCYCDLESIPRASFLWSSPSQVPLTGVATTAGGTLNELVAHVAATGQDVVAIDLTTPDVAELGLHVARVVVPGFHPLQMGHRNRCRGGRRLATIPGRFGRTDWDPDRDNPDPHPFP